jgi:hypothetical protein
MNNMPYAKRMELQRLAEEKRVGLCKVLQEDSRLQQVNRWQEGSDRQRWSRKHAQIQHERRDERQAIENVRQQRSKARALDQEARLAEQLKIERERERVEAARVERIIQADPRLRELQTVIKTSYVNRARASQLQDKAAFEFKNKVLEAQMDKAMKESHAAEARRQEDNERLRKEKVERNKGQLLEQIHHKKEMDKAIMTQEYQRDKQHVDDIMRGIMEEEQRLQKERIEKQEQTRRLIAEYQDQWQSEREKRQKESAAEDQKIREYQDALAERESAKIALKAREAAKQEEIYQEILMQQERIKREAEELAADHEILSIEEMERKQMEQDRMRAAKERKMKQEMIEANEAQKEYKAEQRERDRLMELEMRRKMRAKFEKDLAKEAAIAQRRAEALAQHKLEMQKQKEDRQLAYEEAQVRDRHIEEENRKEEEMREAIIREAARRLLAQHAEVLNEYGPGTRKFQL